MKEWFIDLPGPMVAKVVIAVIVALVFFIYDWIGNTLLDTGGTIG